MPDGPDLSNRQIAQKLGLDKGDAHRMASQLREGIVAAQPEPILSGGAECDEVYVKACHSRDEDGDGFHEVHVNTVEGFWSLPRPWLRPHRDIPQEKRFAETLV